MTASRTQDVECPEDTALAAYLEGSLSAADAQALESHVAECGRCAALLVESDRTRRDLHESLAEPVFNRRVILTALATAALLALAVVAYRWLPSDRSDTAVQQAFAGFLNAYAGSRVVEPRVTGEIAYAPFRLARGSDPASTGAAVTPDVRRAVLAVERAVQGRSDPSALSAWGKTQLLTGQFDGAIAALTRARDAGGRQPDVLANLGAAYIARGIQRDTKEDISRGLELVEEARTLGARDVEVRFNRALALERLDRRPEAIAAWRECIAAESDPDWRREAEEHLSRLGTAGLVRVTPQRAAVGTWVPSCC